MPLLDGTAENDEHSTFKVESCQLHASDSHPSIQLAHIIEDAEWKYGQLEE